MEQPVSWNQSASSGAQPSNRRALAVIFFVMLMDIMGLSFLWPVAPFIVARYSDSALMVTMLTVIYAAAQFFAAPLFGKLGDRYGRRPILLISVVGSIIGYLIFGLAGSLWVLFISRVIDGISGGNLSTASAYIADVSRPETMAQNFALVGLAWSLGLILGPAIGGFFSQFGLNAPVFAAAGFSAIELALAYFLLPESLAKDKRETEPIRGKDLNPLVSIGEMAAKPKLALVLVVITLFNFAFNSISSVQSIFIIDKFNAQPEQVALMLVLFGLTVGVVQLVFVRRIVPRFGEKRVGTASLVAQGVGYLAAIFAPTLPAVFGAMTISSAASGFTFPTLTTLSTKCVSPREVGRLMGVTTALGSVMNIVGPLLAGVVYDHIAPGAPFLIGAIVYAVASLMISRTSVPEVQAEQAWG
ncbi:MAG TPA: MFS transporter [Phototrophicaceae bacterium]|nr:MFS transporter [Phototrophicaceae bacterium]